MFQNYLKIAWRNLRRNKTTSFINVAGLAVGMTVAILIGLWLNDELSFNKQHKHYGKLVQAMTTQTFSGETGTGNAIALPLGEALRMDFANDFQDIAVTSWNFDHVLAVGEKKVSKQGMWAEPALPKMLSLPMIAGNLENAIKEPNTILLSASIAQLFFGDGDPIGKTIKLDNKNDLKVTGVFKDLPHNSEFHDVTYFIPWETYLANADWVRAAQTQWNGNHSFQLFAQLADNTTAEAVSAKIKDIEKNKDKTASSNPQILLHPMSKWHLYSEFKEGKSVGGRIQYVRLFGIIGAFVLLLACINFMNLSTARSEKRAKEVGIRKAIGSLRSHLIGQFLGESFVVVALSLILALALVQFALPWFNEVADKQVSFPWQSATFWASLLSFAAFTGLVSGSYPAFYLSSFEPLKVLKGTFKVGRWSAVPRQALVVLQFTVSVTLIIGTLIVFNQIQYAKNRPVGYSRDGLVQSFLTSGMYGRVEALRTELLNTGMVEEVGQSSSPTTDIWANNVGFDWEGKDPSQNPNFGTIACNEEFGKSIGWEVVEGRDFSREHGTDSTAVILNESAVKVTGLDSIVGKTIRWQGAPKQVIGVVKDMVMQSPYEPIKPTVFLLDRNWASMVNVRLKPGVPVDDAMAAVAAGFTKIDPNSPFDYKFVDDVYDEKFRSEERVGKLSRVFAFLAVFISCLGLFGLSAFAAEQRNKEIGIRKVLGATVANLWAMQSKGFVSLVIIALAIATPLAWYFMNNWLTDYEYHISLGWQVFAYAGILAVAVTLLTVSFQSVKAALANPMKSLRSE